MERLVLVLGLVHEAGLAAELLDLRKDRGLLGPVVVFYQFDPGGDVEEEIFDISLVVGWVGARFDVWCLLYHGIEAPDDDIMDMRHLGRGVHVRVLLILDRWPSVPDHQSSDYG